MSFRLSSSKICRAGILAFACLAFVGAARAGEGARNIEVVPMHGTPMDTNFDQPSVDSQTFKSLSPQAPRTFTPAPRMGQTLLPPPAQQQNTKALERERELLDRRRNWVFMTPEEYASDGKNSEPENNGRDQKPTTAMERYYQRLSDADHTAATNQFNVNKLASDHFQGQTNLLSGDVRPVNGSFGPNPFSEAADAGVFQSVRRSDFSNPFASDSSSAMRTPEEVRLEAEQKTRMDNFRQLWNIDQPAPTLVSSPSPSAHVDSGPLFGLSSPGIQSARPFGGSDMNSSAAPSSAPVSTVTSSRSIKPPHADFIPQQRPF